MSKMATKTETVLKPAYFLAEEKAEGCCGMTYTRVRYIVL